jgi:hypothetical protein
MKNRRKGAFIVMLFALICSCTLRSAKADTLLTSSSSITSPTVIDFSAFGPGITYTSGPVALGSGVTWSSSTPGSSIGSGTYVLLSGTSSNGIWDSNLHDVALGGFPGTMTFTFASPVSSVGAFMNYAPCAVCSDVVIGAYDGSTSLGSFDINLLAPISTPGGVDQGAFRGISAGSPEITSFTVSNSGVILTDLTFGGAAATSVPEPSTIVLLSIGLLGLIGPGAQRLFPFVHPRR